MCVASDIIDVVLLCLQGAVEVLRLVQDILPPVTALVTRCYDDDVTATDTCRRHYAIVESDHPYKAAAVHNYRVTTNYTHISLPPSVRLSLCVCLSVCLFTLAGEAKWPTREKSQLSLNPSLVLNQSD